METIIQISEIRGSDDVEDVEWGLLRCDAVYRGHQRLSPLFLTALYLEIGP
jgi:hypothetical protein